MKAFIEQLLEYIAIPNKTSDAVIDETFYVSNWDEYIQSQDYSGFNWKTLEENEESVLYSALGQLSGIDEENPELYWEKAEDKEYTFETASGGSTRISGGALIATSNIINGIIVQGKLNEARKTVDAFSAFFPQNSWIEKYKTILSPPKIIGTSAPMNKLNESFEAIANLDSSYKKYWVAVSKGEILEKSKDYKYLLDKHNKENTIITFIG